jgi:HSP20 family molecular chaperone IbpA
MDTSNKSTALEMKKILAIAVLLVSTTLSAHDKHLGFFNHNVWNNFERQMAEFQPLQSRQYFDKNKNAYILEVNTQGVAEENLSVKVMHNMLTVHGEQEQTGSNSHSANIFSFSTLTPNDINADAISTDFKRGVLQVSIPKL